jgi:diacylglycerol kinase family enzyme
MQVHNTEGGGFPQMAHAILRGKNNRRHEVDFGDAPLRVEVHASDETVEIFVEADYETLPEERRRFAILNLPRHLFSEAVGRNARRMQSKNR